MNAQIDVRGFHIRPRFTVSSGLSVDQICLRFKDTIQKEKTKYSGKVRKGFVSIYPKPENKHFWSPHFSLSIEPSQSDESITEISVLYGPFPEVWTMFVFFYAIIALFIVITTVIGFANISIGESGRILWVVPLLIIIFTSMYAISYFGQQKGHSQVNEIYNFINKVIEVK